MRYLQKAAAAALVLFLYTVAAGAAHAQGGLDNPLNSSFNSIPNFLAGALKVLVMVALPIISLFIVYAGFKFLTAQGNPGKLGEARENLFYVVIGSILILGAWVIATLIGGTVSQLTK